MRRSPSGSGPLSRTSPATPSALPAPVGVDEEDGLSLHLVGLTLSRAWCLAGLAETMDDQPAASALFESAARHAGTGVRRAFTDDYAGEH